MPSPDRIGSRAWTAWAPIGAITLLGLLAIASGVWQAMASLQDEHGNSSAAMYTLLDTGRALEAEINRTVQPAIARTNILAKSPDVIKACTSGSSATQTALLNSAIAAATEVDALAIFDSTGRITAINTCYANGQPIPKERVTHVLGMDMSQLPIIHSCLRNSSATPILEFQTHCTITPAFFGSTGLSVAYSVPIINLQDGTKLGVISSRLRFERLSSLIEGKAIAGGSAKAYFITDAGGYFSEAINSGREQPPIPVTELRDIVRSTLSDASSQKVTKRADKYLAIFSLADVETLEGGGIHILILADGNWLTQGPRQDRLIHAAGAGLVGALLLIIAGLGHARLVLLRSNSIIERANQGNARLVEQIQLLLDSTGEGIYGIDTAGRCTFINQTAAKLLGYSTEEILGKQVHDLLHSKHYDGSAYAVEQCPIHRVLLSGRSCRVDDEVFWRRDGSALPAEYSSFPIIEDGKVTGAVITFCDISDRQREEEALRLSEERLRLALDSAKLGTFDFKPLTGELNWDGANKLIWGLAEHEEVNYPEALKRLHPDDALRVQEEVKKSLNPQGNGCFESEYRIIWPDSSVHWTIGRGKVHFEGAGEQRCAVRMVGVQIDVTDRKLAEEALRLNTQRLRHAQSIGRIGDWDFDVAAQRITWSDELFHLFGEDGSNEPPSYARLLTYFVPEDAARIDAATTTAIGSGESSVLDVQLRLSSAGAPVFHHAIITAITDEDGKVVRLRGTSQDITDRMKAEAALQRAHAELERRVTERTAELEQANEALRLSEADLQRAKDAAEAASRAKGIVFDTALDAIVTIDVHGVITQWNLQAETIFRWERTEAIGRRLDQTIFSQSEWAAHAHEIEVFLKTGEGPLLNSVAELIAAQRDGHEFPVELAITPAWSGTECTFTAFIRDITVRKQAEADLRQARDAAENASRAKSEFVANMSHEIRTPLSGVIGMSGLLLETALDEKQRRFAELIRISGTSLSDLINDILDFSKIEARKMEIESVDFDLYALVEEVAELMSLKASQKGLDLACLTMPEVPRQVKGDANRIKQILVNLINNAIKFTSSGSVSLRLVLEARSPEHAEVRFSIIDTGIGIPADRMDRLFKSFSQVDSSTTRTYGGTGLGLAISKQLAELMGGSIGVVSTPGHGSTFWFTTRLGPGSQAQPLVSTAAAGSGHWRVLTAQSSPIMGETLRTQLRCWGLEAAVASTADEAMKMLIEAAANGSPYDAAILDGELPDANTLDLGKAIKARHEIAGTVLLILLPMGSDLEPLKLRAAGFSGHLIKPVRQSRLYDSIVDAMDSTSPRKDVVAETLPVASNSVDSTPRVRILIAEDNRVNQIVASEMLAKHGYGFDIVDNGRKAVAAVLTGNYDLVLMDCLMPELDGFEATRQVRAAEVADSTYPRRRTPIIALTANAINGDRERCLEAGMDDYVSKPIDPHRLITAIRTRLATSRWGPATALAVSLVKQPEIASAPVVATIPSISACDETPPLTINVLLDRCMGNAEVVTSILDEFDRQAISDLAEIKRLVESGDCEGTARVAHTLKGASGILSADTLSDVAFKLERMGRTGELATADQLLTQLDNEVHRCIDFLPTVRQVIANKSQV